MKAVVFEEYGGPETLRVVERPKPVPAHDEILIAVAASSINPADWRLRSGQFKYGMRLTLPFTPGNDLSGRVVEIGPGVTGFTLGDLVFAMTPLKAGGACAEFVAVNSALVAHAPRAIPLAEVAALPLAGLTALQALTTYGQLQAGQKMLVGGASGGVGHFAVQIAKALGAEVSGLCSSGSAPFVRGLGVEEVYDYANPASFAGPRRFDLVFDAVAKEYFYRWRQMLRADGTVVTTNPVIGKILPDALTSLFGIPRLRSFFVQPSGADLRTLADLVDTGIVKPRIAARFALGDLAAAHRVSAVGRVRGKLLVDITSSLS